MNNRYLFRAKRTDNGRWMEGNYIYDGVTGKVYIHAAGNSVNESDKVGEDGYLRFVAFEIDPSTVCQCTGLPDKNGRKIFEGDIINSDGDIGIVKFGRYQNDFHFGFYVDWISCPHLRSELGYWNERSSVVGNIFDNPELLKVGK